MAYAGTTDTTAPTGGVTARRGPHGQYHEPAEKWYPTPPRGISQ